MSGTLMKTFNKIAKKIFRIIKEVLTHQKPKIKMLDTTKKKQH